MIVAWFS